MKWSQLKKQIEDKFADSVKGRVEVWNTRYRKAYDQEGEMWITIDNKRIQCMADGIYWETVAKEAENIRGIPRYEEDYSGSITYWNAFHKSRESVLQQGIFPLHEANEALFNYLSMSIDDILSSDNPLIQAFGMLDKRLGKRRLRTLNIHGNHSLVLTLFAFRCSSEGLSKNLSKSPIATNLS
jgi:hypothetical protein